MPTIKVNSPKKRNMFFLKFETFIFLLEQFVELKNSIFDTEITKIMPKTEIGCFLYLRELVCLIIFFKKLQMQFP